MILNLIKGWRAKCKALAGHIWPVGRMLCMPVLDHGVCIILQFYTHLSTFVIQIIIFWEGFFC